MDKNLYNIVMGLAVIGLSIAVFRQSKTIKQMQAKQPAGGAAVMSNPFDVLTGAWGGGDITAGAVAMGGVVQ